MCIFLLLIGCTHTNPINKPQDSVLTDSQGTTAIDSEDSQVTTDPLQQEAVAEDLHARRFFADTAGRLHCEAGSDGVEKEVEPGTIILRGFLSSTTYNCQLGTATATFETAALPSDFPALTSVVAAPVAEAGLHLLNVGSSSPDSDHNGFLAILDSAGQVRWQQAGKFGGSVSAMWLGEGKILVGADTVQATAGAGTPHILDLDNQTSWSAQEEVLVPGHQSDGWSHEALWNGSTILTLATVQVSESNNSWVGFIVQELGENGETLWYWSVYEALSQGLVPRANDPDPFHANSLWETVEDGKRKIWINLRNADEVLKVDYESRQLEDQIRAQDWTLIASNGVRADWFHHAHHFRRQGSQITLYDNGTRSTRALVGTLDLNQRSLTLSREWEVGGWEEAWGSTQISEDGRLEVGVGHLNGIGTVPQSFIAQIDADGTVQMRTEFVDPRIMLYRVERLPACGVLDIAAGCYD